MGVLERLWKTFGLIGFTLAIALSGAACEIDDDEFAADAIPLRPLGRTEALTVLSTRILPIQNVESMEDLLAMPPIKHGNPGATMPVEPEWIDTDTDMAITTFPNLGVVAEGDGLARVKRTQLGVDSTSSTRGSVFYLLHLSDLQVQDEESPGITPTNDFSLADSSGGGGQNALFQGSYRPHGAFLPWTADALIRTANDIADGSRAYNLAVHTGDAVENAQFNELLMFMTLLDGGLVDPDSGPSNGVIPGVLNDPNDKFFAEGLNAPWMSIIGNHDILGQGNFPIAFLQFLNTPGVFEQLQLNFGAAPGRIAIPNLGNAGERHDHLTTDELYMRRSETEIAGLNGVPFDLEDMLSWTELEVAFEDFYNMGDLQPQLITPDFARTNLGRCEWVQAHMDFANPADKLSGHGFIPSINGPPNPSTDRQCVGHWWFVPPENGALRFVSLDLAYEYGGAEGTLADPQVPFNLLALQALTNVYSDTQIDMNYDGNTDLVKPDEIDDTNPPLFFVPIAQGALDAGDDGDAVRDAQEFLADQIAEAEANDQLMVLLTHHAPEDMVIFNEFRFTIETLICRQINAAAGGGLDCDPTDGTMSTGDFGAPVGQNDPTLAGNEQALDLFASLISGGMVTDYDMLPQAAIDAAVGMDAAGVGALISAFELLLTLRQILPDPVNAIPPEPDPALGIPAGMGLTLREMLAAGSNVILHIAGHSHRNQVLAVCPDGTTEGATSGSDCAATGGYWEIQTAANADWPMEQRVVEFVDNDDGTMSIYGTNFGFALDVNQLAEQGRRLATADVETSAGSPHLDDPGDVNVELVVEIPAAVDTALDGVGSRTSTIESTTSLPMLMP